MIDLSKLKQAADAATPGIWRECGAQRGGCICGHIWATESDECVAIAFAGDEEMPAPAAGVKPNAAYIAAANPSAILELIARLEAAEAKLAQEACVIFKDNDE